MNPDRWQRVEALYGDAIAQPPSQRSAFLAEACAGDDALRAEVQSLLDQTTLDGGRLANQPAAASGQVPLQKGQRLGTYEIRGLLGVGGMGEVYRAHDTRLGREVAIKVLPHRLTDDPARLARFEREARMLASLNHPNIAAIYGVEDAAAESGQQIRALVLELVEGPTLADVIAQGALNPSTAIGYAIQIAHALETAHEKGIVHRDIKPANIKVDGQGTIKVLDFGLAAPARGVTDDQATNSPTVGAPTAPGILMGTLPYMSPEQASGQPLDRRTDVWAFGCVLYEMLTGRRVFAGATASDTLLRILQREPEWNALPAGLPGGVVRVLRRALTKDPQQRLRDLGDARLDLQAPAMVGDAGDAAGLAAPSRRWFVAAMVGVALVGAVAGGAISRLLRLDPPRTSSVTSRFAIAVEPHEVLARVAAISPDGQYVAYLAGPSGNQKTYLRRVGDAKSRVIAQLPLQSPQPFFSPDSQWVAFFDAGKLKKLPIAGGSPVTLAEAPTPRGGTWGADGSIVFAPISRGGLVVLPADGGPAQALTKLDTAAGETSHRQPSFLPQSRTVLFVADATSDRSVRAVSLDSKQVRLVQSGDALDPRYTPTGHLTYVVDRKLMAAPFDPATLKVNGPAVALVEGVDTYSFSAFGTLVFVAAANYNIRTSTLVWVGRNGGVSPLPPPPSTYEHPRLSADARAIVVGRIETADRNLWVYDLVRDTLSKFTFESNNDWPVWSADGTKIFYASNRAGTQYDVMSRPVDGSGPEEVVLARPLTQIPRAVAPTGDALIFEETYPDRPNTLWRLPLQPGGEGRPLMGAGNGEMMPTFSPDGRWVAYVSPQSARSEIYVRSGSGEGRTWQVSNNGGVEPVWSFSGRELFYRADDKMMTVDVSLGATPTFGKPRVLFEGSYIFGTTEGQAFDVARDGQRFLMLKPQRPLTAEPLQVIVNWFDAVREQSTASR